MSLVNKRLSKLTKDVLFYSPKFRNPVMLADIRHLPIRVIRISDIRTVEFLCGCFSKRDHENNFFPPSVNTVILDSRSRVITPNIIRRNSEIMFIASTNYLSNSAYHFSNYLLPNFALYTSSSCMISIQRLQQYRDFRFKFLIFSHFEAIFQTVSQEERLDALAELNIDRVILNFCAPVIKPQFFEKISRLNIVFLSSDIFGKFFPLQICPKLSGLEIIHFRQGCQFEYSEFEKIRYISVTGYYIGYYGPCNCNLKEYEPNISHLIKKDKCGLAKARISFYLYLKSGKDSTLHKLEIDSYTPGCLLCKPHKRRYSNTR